MPSLSQRSFNLAIAILISLIAFKLLTPLVLPVTWNPSIRATQINHLPLSIQLIAFFISCGLELTTPLVVGWRDNKDRNFDSPSTTFPSTRKQISNQSPPLWAIISYLLLVTSQIILAINYIYTNSNSLTSLPPSLSNKISITQDQIRKIEFWSVVSYGILVLGGAIFGVCRGNGRKKGISDREGEIQLIERDEPETVEERYREEEEGELEEHDLGPKVEIQEHPGRL